MKHTAYIITGPTASGKSSSVSTAQTLYVRPAAPTALTFSALNSIKGTGTSADPFIAFEINVFLCS